MCMCECMWEEGDVDKGWSDMCMDITHAGKGWPDMQMDTKYVGKGWCDMCMDVICW